MILVRRRLPTTNVAPQGRATGPLPKTVGPAYRQAFACLVQLTPIYDTLSQSQSMLEES